MRDDRTLCWEMVRDLLRATAIIYILVGWAAFNIFMAYKAIMFLRSLGGSE